MIYRVQVTVLEARARIGGRVHTVKAGGASVDMGAMVVTGVPVRLPFS